MQATKRWQKYYEKLPKRNMIEIDKTENVSAYEMANKIAQENFGSQKYNYIKEVITNLNIIVESNCEFTSEKILGLYQLLQETGGFQL